MNEIKWNNELSVGVKDIDDQHKELISIANSLIHAVETKAGRTTVEKVIKRLRAYTVAHFAAEEKLMEEAGFPKLGAHQAEHQKLKTDVQQFQRELYVGKGPTPGKVLAFIKVWLLDHILKYDRGFARFLKEKGSEGKVVKV